VTENGYGKRTAIDEYRLTTRGAKGVKTITFAEAKGLLAGALVVREHQDLVFISQNGMVQRTSVRGINRYGRASQGVRVMNLREEDTVSAVALVVESEAGDAIADEAPLSLDASGAGDEAALEGDDVVFAGDPDAEAMLPLPELESDEMPDSDIEDE
jgi:DNA gyrase subunit A